MNTPARILIADDDPSVRQLLALRLEAAGYETCAAADGREAFGLISGFQPHVVLADLKMPRLDGMSLFAAIRERHSTLPVIILTAHGTIPDAVDATHRGVFGYLTKPFDSQSLLDWVARALQSSGIQDDPQKPNHRWSKNIITRNAEMESVLSEASVAAASDSPILIRGESGTGKRSLARDLHHASGRSHGPFVEANAAVIPKDMLAAEFFGQKNKPGLFERADGGTLFIDEINALPPNLQFPLLKTLRDGYVHRIGENKAIPVDVRLITTRRQDRDEKSKKPTLRQDLFYAISVVSLTLPPLRARRDDIPPLVAHFLGQNTKQTGSRVNGFSPRAMERLLAAPWPGNIRELRHIVERTVALANTPLIPEDLVIRALEDTSGEGELAPLNTARDEFERDYLVQLLRIAEGNISHAARLAQRNRTEFYKLLHRHHLEPKSFRVRKVR